mgnify:CR=1 FL=1
MRKTITSFLALVAMMFATSANAQETFTYDIQSYVGSSYEGYTQKLDVEAIAAVLGCSVAESTPYAVLPDGTLDDECQPGDTDGWRDAEGNWKAWATSLDDAPYFYVKLNVENETNEIYDVGGYPGHTNEATTYTATYKLVNPNDESKACFITVNLTYVPEPEFEVNTNPAELEIVGKAELAVEQKPRTNTTGTSYKVQVGDLPTLLGLDADVFGDFWRSKLVYGIGLDSETLLKSATLVQYSSSRWLNILYDEDANPLDECYIGSSGEDSRFRAVLGSFDGDSITVSVSQTGSLKAPATYNTTYYIINGSKAFELKVVLNLIPDEVPDLPWEEKTCVGKETITLVSERLDDYDAQDVDIDLDAIIALFPEGTAISDLAFTALTSDGLPTTSYTTNTTGFWMDMESHPMGWSLSVQSYYVDYSSSGTLTIGHIPNQFEKEGETKPTGSLYLVYKNDYYEFVMDYMVGPKEVPDVPDPLLSTAEIVAVRSFEMQIIPSSTTYQDDYMNQAIDFNLAEIQELIGTTSYRLWGQQWSETRGFYSSNSQQSMSGCSQGFWMNQDTINHCAVVGSWGASIGNAFGIGISSSNSTTFNFFQYPGQRKVGDQYPSVFYFVNTDRTKCVQINILVKYVSERVTYDIVGQTSIDVTGVNEDDPEESAITEFDLTDMFNALGCTQEEFEAAGEWVAIDGEGAWSTQNYVEPGGFQFKADGSTTGEADEVFMAGFNDLFEFESYIIDEANRSNTYTAQIAARYDGKLYIFNVTVKGDGVDTAINSVAAATKANGAIYNVAGQLLTSPQKGINIIGGKKVLVK